jgi:uncharacterized membrane protein YdjX (TVP38/TMEM64 family)
VQVARWLEPSLWLLILIRTGSIVLLPSSVNRIPLVLVLLRPTAEVLLVSAATAHGVRLVTVAVLALLSRVLMNLAMFILLTKYAPVLASRFLPQRQLRIVDWLRSNATKRTLLIICAIHPSKIVVVACALARVKLARFVVGIVIGNTLVVCACLVIGRYFTAELRFIINWVWARRWWLTAALLPLIGFPVVFAIRRRR